MLEEAAKEREQDQLVRYNPCQNTLVAPKKGVQNIGKDLPQGKPPPWSSADLFV